MALRNKRWIERRGPAIALAVAAGLSAFCGPAAAQNFFWGNRPSQHTQEPPSRDYFGFPFFGGPRPPPVADYSRAPPPRKLETPPTSNIVVIGDSMADWLAYGLDQTYADQPDVGVIREIRAASGLIRYDAKNESLDWPAAIKDALAAEMPNAIVVMLGLNDRIQIRDGAPPRSPQQQNGAAAAAAKAAEQTAKNPPAEKTPAAADSEAKPEQSVAGTEAQRPVPGALYEFHSDQWAALYAKRIDEMIAALKAKGVPVLWVGLPAIRGPKSMSDMAYLDELYRERAERAGIIYVDIWDGFVDDQGRYAVEGPDFEGQIRRLRTGDGVHFSKAGAAKLASYVDQELRRVMSSHAVPVALPMETSPAKPGTPRPDVGPVLPLTASGGEGGGLLGAGGHPAPVASDPLAAKVLSRGGPIPAPAGRADDFSWPRPADNASATGVTPESASLSPGAPPAKKAASGHDETKKPAEIKKDENKKPVTVSGAAKTRRSPSAELDGAPVPPLPVGSR